MTQSTKGKKPGLRYHKHEKSQKSLEKTQAKPKRISTGKLDKQATSKEEIVARPIGKKPRNSLLRTQETNLDDSDSLSGEDVEEGLEDIISDEEASDEETNEEWQDVRPIEIKPDLKQNLRKANESVNVKPGVIYLGRIPHGFFEPQILAYFSQFGEVSRLRLSRNKKTGRSKHYAFLEFNNNEVAKIVAETMNNYLLAGHILKCVHVPSEKVHPQLFKGSRDKFRKIPWVKLEQKRRDKPKSETQYRNTIKRLMKKDAQKKKKLKELGIDYEYAGYIRQP